MNADQSAPAPLADSKPATDDGLIDQLQQRRAELASAADVLKTPLRAVNRAEAAIRNIGPILPYAIAAIAVASVGRSLLRGRGVRPTLLIATGLDLLRLWKSFHAISTLSHNAASQTADVPSLSPINHQEHSQ